MTAAAGLDSPGAAPSLLVPGPRSARTAASLPRWKRWTDCAIAGPLLVISLPVMLTAMTLVKLTSRGPALYSQTRLGLNRRQFTLYKIRSMTHNCEAATGACWSGGRKDPRVTFIGRILRATHIDELPQLWNVLRGEMTLVGPRPERPEIVARIEPLIPGYAERLSMVPGLTGLAQVQLPPDVDLDSVRRKLRYDVYYGANQGFWLDIRLIVVTAGKVIGLLATVRSLLRIPGPNRVESSAETTELPFVVDPPAVATPEPDLSGA
ncbi:MAG TPA: sugar transferase [Gemmataceae bacterium]|nr:sugar transferase [Gemmataceae bacterium]